MNLRYDGPLVARVYIPQVLQASPMSSPRKGTEVRMALQGMGTDLLESTRAEMAISMAMRSSYEVISIEDAFKMDQVDILTQDGCSI